MLVWPVHCHRKIRAVAVFCQQAETRSLLTKGEGGTKLSGGGEKSKVSSVKIKKGVTNTK